MITGEPRIEFTADNWNQDQTIRVWAKEDNVDEGDSYGALLSHSVRSTDDLYHNLAIDDGQVVVQDNDTAAVVVSPTDLQVGTGQAGEYTVRLTSQPLSQVAVFLTPVDGLQLDAAACDEEGGQCLLFTPENWDAGQRVTVSMQRDPALGAVIEHKVISSDAAYQGIAAAPVRINGGARALKLYLPVILQ